MLLIAAQLGGSETLMLMVVFVLLLILIFLAVAETGLNQMTKPKAAAIADERQAVGPRRWFALVSEHPERCINPLLLTVNICQTAQAYLTGIVAGRLFGGLGCCDRCRPQRGRVLRAGRGVPKTWAVLHPERAARSTARPVNTSSRSRSLRLISRGLIGLTNVMLRGKGLKKGPFVSEQELLGIVEAAAEDEVIEHEERELIESIIEFGDTVAREIMMPRPDMVIHPERGDDLERARPRDRERIQPAARCSAEGDDDVIGLAYTKDLIRAEREGRGDLSVLDLARPVRFIPENKPVSRLMREMQAGKFHLAIVADEYGDVAGLVTLEDCLEELVGEIVDEYDIEEHHGRAAAQR